jgi:transcriptional regulator GlxA family with amidase domain
VIHHIEDQSFNVVDFADEMCMSRVHLYRKLKALTGESISSFVNTIRLKVAMKLLCETDMSVKQVAYTVGFSDPKYFSRCFKKKFNYQPSKMK